MDFIKIKPFLEFFKTIRSWAIWIIPMLIIYWYYKTDPNEGAETLLRIQYFAWAWIAAGCTYIMRKALMPGDSKTLFNESRNGNTASAIIWLGMAILTGLIFMTLVGKAMATEVPQKLPERAIIYLPVLNQEITDYWEDVPLKSSLAAQVEQETCYSLKHKKCWNPTAELKTSREYGFGLGMVTSTAKFDNFKEARKLDITLRDWDFEDRFNASKQLRTMVLMDKNGYNRLKFVPDEIERLAMTFAQYNGGMGGLLSDRRLCNTIKGCDPNVWFNNVELYSLKAKKATSGYGKSFFEINREYPKNILGSRRVKYMSYFNEGIKVNEEQLCYL